ncbi:MAG: hypothetical protein ACYSUX_18000 [Planctomycetota bacterium]|jgi:hypothetical protein
MENQKNSLKVKFSIVIGCILAVLLCAAPCSAEYVMVAEGQTVNIGSGEEYEQVDFLSVYGTVNLHPGAHVNYAIYAFDGCEINFYGGQMGMGDNDPFILVFSSGDDPDITVHGANFAVNEDPCEPSATVFTLVLGEYQVLTGIYGNNDPINLRFFGFGNIPINLVTIDSGVQIDIKPGSDENNINLGSRGVVPVAVLTTDDFDAATVNPATAQFAGAAPVHWSLEDVDGDGDEDVIFHFRTQELDLDADSTVAILTAQLTGQMGLMSARSAAPVSGGTISGSDEVNIVSSKNKSKKK